MSALFLAAVLSTMHYEGDCTGDGGDFHEVEFVVPPGTIEIQITHSDGSSDVILDWGVWGPTGFAAGAAATPKTRSSASTNPRAAICPDRSRRAHRRS